MGNFGCCPAWPGSELSGTDVAVPRRRLVQARPIGLGFMGLEFRVSDSGASMVSGFRGVGC